jgi:hypothetical protein
LICLTRSNFLFKFIKDFCVWYLINIYLKFFI